MKTHSATVIATTWFFNASVDEIVDLVSRIDAEEIPLELWASVIIEAKAQELQHGALAGSSATH